MRTLYNRFFEIFKRTGNNRTPCDAGFTLIEILVASAIASIILMIVYTSYQSIVKSIKRATGHAEFYENVNLAIAKMDMDISNTYYTRTNKKITFFSEEDAGNNRLSFVVVSHNDYIFSGNMTKPYPVSDIKEIGYYLKADKSTQGLYTLIKREKVHYGEDPAIHADSATEDIILVNVVSLKYEFQRGNDWDDAWDSRRNNMFPRAVRTTLVAKNYQAKDEKFEFISLVNMREFR